MRQGHGLAWVALHYTCLKMLFTGIGLHALPTMDRQQHAASGMLMLVPHRHTDCMQLVAQLHQKLPLCCTLQACKQLMCQVSRGQTMQAEQAYRRESMQFLAAHMRTDHQAEAQHPKVRQRGRMSDEAQALPDVLQVTSDVNEPLPYLPACLA